MINTPSNLELLLHCYYSPEIHPRYDAPAIQEGIRYLNTHGMISEYEYNGEKRAYIWEVTDKGFAFIKHLMKIPFPEQKWEIPS